MRVHAVEIQVHGVRVQERRHSGSHDGVCLRALDFRNRGEPADVRTVWESSLFSECERPVYQEGHLKTHVFRLFLLFPIIWVSPPWGAILPYGTVCMTSRSLEAYLALCLSEGFAPAAGPAAELCLAARELAGWLISWLAGSCLAWLAGLAG